MKAAPARLLCLLAAIPLAAAGAERFDRTRTHIDALLARRLHPSPLPPKIANPFQATGDAAGGTVRSGGGEPAVPGDRGPAANPDTPPSDDAGILAFYARTLRISGLVELNGRSHLIVNQSPYKEGDLILLRGQESAIYLRVEKITPAELTLGYNDSILVISLKN